MRTLRITPLALVFTIAFSTASPALAYHDQQRTLRTPGRYITHYMDQQIAEDVFTAYQEEHKAYTRYDLTHRQHPHYSAFGHAAQKKKANLEALRILLRNYGVPEPLTGNTHTYQGYGEQDTCREAYETEIRVERLYDILIAKMSRYSDIREAMEDAQRDARNLQDTFHKCATTATAAPHTGVYQRVRPTTLYRTPPPKTHHSHARIYSSPRYSTYRTYSVKPVVPRTYYRPRTLRRTHRYYHNTYYYPYRNWR